MKNLIFIAALMSLTCVASFAQETSPKKFHRQIFVPFENLDVLLEGNSNRVLLDRKEYDTLLESARVREVKRAPLDSAVVSAKYTGNIADGVATIKGELIIEPLNEGLIEIPLPLSGVAIRSATLGDEPAKLWRNKKNEIVLLTAGDQRETLTIEMTVPLQTTAARQAMSIQLPSPSATSFNLTVPGNVEVKSGVPVANRTYDEANNATTFDLLASRTGMNIVMSLNNRLLKDDQVVVSRSVLIHKLTPHVQEMHATCSLDVIHGAIEEIQFDIPAGFEVSNVSTELLSQWEMANPEDNDGSQRLVVKLRQPTREDVVLNIAATRNDGVIGEWTAADIRPVDVAGHVSVVGVLADTEIKSSQLTSTGVIPIDHAFLLAALPESVRESGSSNPLAVVAAFYAPQTDYTIKSKFSAPDAELIVKSNSRLMIDDQQLELQGGMSLTSRHESRFDFTIALPKGWRLSEITDISGAAIRFDRLDSDDSAEFLVHLDKKIAHGTPTKVFFKATLTPEGWLEKWESNKVSFPTLKIDGQTKHTGAIAVSTTEDWVFKPETLIGIEVLSEEDKRKFELNRDQAPLAYQFDDSNYELTLEVNRLKPTIIARTYNYATIQTNQITVRAELIYDVKQASKGEFKFELPLDSPKSISIRAKDDQLKDYLSKDSDTARQWTVQLAKPRKGRVHLLIDYDIPITEEKLAELKLSPVVVSDVNFQSSMFAVEGSSELDITIETEGRPVDVGELAESVYQPGRYMLGAYSWPNEKMTLTVKSTRRPVYQLPSAIVQRAEMVTSISTDGKSQTAARFQLVTKQQPFLRVELPKDSTLWSVQLDGQPAKPQRQNDALLISLIGNETGKLRDLQLVFESPANAFTLVGKVQSQAPTLWLNQSAEGEGTPVPLVDLHWRLMMPDGFSVSHGDGDFQSEQLVKRKAPIEQLANWVCRLGGGGRNYFSMRKGRAYLSDEAPMFGFEGSIAGEKFEDQAETAIGTDMGIRSRNLGSAPTDSPSFLPPAPEEANNDPFGDAEQGESQQGGSQAGRFANELPGDKKKSKTAGLWALSGLGSLDIKLTDTGNTIDFVNLGEQPVLTATVIHQSRLNWIAIALALFIGALGVLLTHRSAKTKVMYVLCIILIASLVPLAGVGVDGFRTVVDLAILAAVLVAIYFIIAGICGLIGRSVFRVATKVPATIAVLAIMFSSLGLSEQANAQDVVKDATELRRLIAELQTGDKAVPLPADAIIIPFDAEDPEGREKADRLLIPYNHYLTLLNNSDPDNKNPSPKSPVDFVIASSQYDIALTLDEDIAISGRMVIELLTDEAVSVTLPMIGGALADAQVDGQPAKLQFAELPTKQKRQQKSATNTSVVQLHLEGRGRKTFEFTVRMKPKRQGGWRMISARLPIGMTRGLDLTSLDEPTEVRLNIDSERRTIEAKPKQEIASVLSADGGLQLQWKPSTAAQTVDQSLTAKSEGVFDVREDGLRLNWRVDLDFRGAERDTFTLNLPDGFLVEQVVGENIRAWDVKQANDGKQLNVTLLGTAKDKETFTIELSNRDFSVGEAGKVTDLQAPYLTVEGAALHKGVYTIRRSPIVELKTNQLRAASRIDANQFQCRIDMAAIDANSSPLGIESFQSLQFLTTPFQIGIEAQLIPLTIKADTESILRIGQSEADLEMRIKIAAGQRPIYQLSFELPLDAEIRRLSAGLNETYTTETINDVQRVQMFFPTGVSDRFSIVVEAALTEFTGGTQWKIPGFKVNDATEQKGQIAIQVDPAFTVTATELKDCETVLLSQIQGWMNADQRKATRLALKTKGTDYEATLRFKKIEPRVTVETVTNVRTTYFAIEETMLLDFNIQQAGIRQIQFELPIEMRSARIVAKLVSETLIEDIADNPNAVRVTLNLQDDVIDSYRVVIENDRQLSDDRQSVPMPRVLTGTTEQRYVTLQNAGRDEISALPSEDFQTLNRQLSQYAQLKQKLSGGELTMAYLANAKPEWPTLEYETQQREMFDTVAASIEFSKTTMVVDSSGAYRALQNFQVNNRSEQYLEIELPTEARLLTVLVSGQPVKPVAWPAANNDRRLRIPLVKTPLGDLDYAVQLKYAGQLGSLSNFSEVEFPVIETLNINVQLSQLHLRLPESHQWMNFGGTMTKVDGQGELEESFLSYKSRQIQQLAEQIQSSMPGKNAEFFRSRAAKNLEVLQQELSEYESKSESSRGPLRGHSILKDLIRGNQNAIEQAQQSYQVEAGKFSKVQVDNRANLNALVEQQSARISRNAVTRGGQNFNADIPQQAQTATPKYLDDSKSMDKISEALKSNNGFDGEWLMNNKLDGKKSVAKGKNGRGEEIQAFTPNLSLIVGNESNSDDDSVTYFNPADKSGGIAGGRGLGGEMAGGMGGMGGGGRGGMGQGGGGFGGGMGQGQGEGQGQGQGPGQDPAIPNFQKQGGIEDSSLSSLDIELPTRGVDFYFKSPRGNASVLVRPIETQSFARWTSALIAIGVCLAACIVFWFVTRMRRFAAARLIGGLVLVIAGLFSFAFVPVYSLLALAAAFALFIDWATQGETGTADFV